MARRRDVTLVQDILEAIDRISRYTAGLSYTVFVDDTLIQDAVVRNLEIIGEAVKALSPDFRKKRKNVRWQDIAGMRDRLIHDYAGVNWEIVWDVVQTKLPELKALLVTLIGGGKG